MHAFRGGTLSSRGAYAIFPGNGTSTRLEGKHRNLFVRHQWVLRGARNIYLLA